MKQKNWNPVYTETNTNSKNETKQIDVINPSHNVTKENITLTWFCNVCYVIYLVEYWLHEILSTK